MELIVMFLLFVSGFSGCILFLLALLSATEAYRLMRTAPAISQQYAEEFALYTVLAVICGLIYQAVRNNTW